MKRLAVLLIVPSLVLLEGCGGGGSTYSGSGGSAGSGGGSSSAGGSKSGGSGGSSSSAGSSSGGSTNAGSGNGGSSSGGGSSGSKCTQGCSMIAQLDCPGENPATCVSECEQGEDRAYEMYPECVAEYDAAIDCVLETPLSEWQCDDMGQAVVGEDDCVEEADAFLSCALATGG